MPTEPSANGNILPQNRRRNFKWKKPSAPINGLHYSDQMMGEIERRVRYGPKGDTKVKLVIQKSSPLGFVAHNSSQVFVVFRGTSLAIEWTKVNARFKQVPCKFGSNTFGNVHKGFLQYYKSVAGEMHSLLGPIVQGKELVVTGHSLGGGVAAVALADCLARYRNKASKISSYSFACPRVGDLSYNKKLALLDAEAYRIVNTEDLVPNLPPANTGKCDFRHYGGVCSFTAHYETIALTHNTPALIYAIEHPLEPETSKAGLIQWAKDNNLVQVPR